MATCPDGHDSATDDFCDVCGRQIGAVPAVSAEAPCPVCGEPVAGRFCEGCGHDMTVSVTTWTAVVAADRVHFDSVSSADEELVFPLAQRERVVLLVAGEVHIGRWGGGVAPDIDLTGDPGVSHRHALLRGDPAGGWTLTDPGSTNGTTLNDNPEAIAVGVPVPLRDGDRIHVGAWTTITIRAGEHA
ncbi:FHA domain-containing protein [Kutzneria buriramensis]|uniref:FHA domain-containing protein n=1 Tax=Kutzneria buriramensis TaxID=1045776 RepID=A0A3E0HL20_9PSEU|nr:FHA domain-containing protein [Kutzneria buriramensis]REH46906.1 FHA domain-containing protein [Kutzneria buriramensis]